MLHLDFRTFKQAKSAITNTSKDSEDLGTTLLDFNDFYFVTIALIWRSLILLNVL